MTIPGPSGTTHIGVRSATNVFHAVRFAAGAQRPLSTAVTINWDRLGLDDHTATRAFRQLRQKVRRRWTYLRQSRGLALGPFDDAGVHENPDGHRNTHWLVHVPAFFARPFRGDVARFLKKLLRVEQLGRALHFKDVGAPGTYAKYMLKGVDPRFRDYFHMKSANQGFVEGRGRTFVSRGIGLTARRRAAWSRKRRTRS